MKKLNIKEISINKTARAEIVEILEKAAAIKLDFVNNYLTKEKFAEHNGISEKIAELILELGKIALEDQESFNNDL